MARNGFVNRCGRDEDREHKFEGWIGRDMSERYAREPWELVRQRIEPGRNGSHSYLYIGNTRADEGLGGGYKREKKRTRNWAWKEKIELGEAAASVPVMRIVA